MSSVNVEEVCCSSGKKFGTKTLEGPEVYQEWVASGGEPGKNRRKGTEQFGTGTEPRKPHKS